MGWHSKYDKASIVPSTQPLRDIGQTIVFRICFLQIVSKLIFNICTATRIKLFQYCEIKGKMWTCNILFKKIFNHNISFKFCAQTLVFWYNVDLNLELYIKKTHYTGCLWKWTICVFVTLNATKSSEFRFLKRGKK